MLSLGMEAFRGRCRGLIRVFVVGFGVYALLFEVIRFRFRSFRVLGFGFRASRVPRCRCRGLEFRIWGLPFSSLGFRV